MSTMEEKLIIIKKHIKSYKDFPKKGILFWDIFSVFNEPNILQLLKEVLIDTVKQINPPVDCIVGLDARGFLLGPILALEFNVPFVPIRKKGKLPGKTVNASYSKEYGEDILEIQIDSIKKGQRVLLVDDLVATGGTLVCAHDLIKLAQAEVTHSLVIIELEEFNTRVLIPSKMISLIKL